MIKHTPDIKKIRYQTSVIMKQALPIHALFSTLRFKIAVPIAIVLLALFANTAVAGPKIKKFFAGTYDFGDAPASYDLNNAGTSVPARQLPSTSIYIGTSRGFAEVSKNVVANNSNNNSSNGDGTEEDGLTAPPQSFVPGTAYSVRVKVTNTTGTARRLQGWVDFDNDGVFESNEYAFVTIGGNLAAGSETVLTWSASQTSVASAGDALYVRLRVMDGAPSDNGSTNVDERAIADGTSSGVYGTANDGEIEDYRVVALTGFSCNYLVYQIAGTNLYSYNLALGGSPTLVKTLNFNANAIGYNPSDKQIWGWDTDDNRVFSVDATGRVQLYAITGLPADNYNVGDIAGGYLYLYSQGANKFYVVNTNPTTTDYLSLTNTVSLSGASTTLNINDWAYNTVTGKLTGLVNPSAGSNPFKIVTITLGGVVSYSSTQVSGGNIQNETGLVGAVYADASGTFYVFANDTGDQYSIDLGTNTATKLSVATASGSNDGAACYNATFIYTLQGTIYDDSNGLTDGAVNGTGYNPGNTLYAVLYNNTTSQEDDRVIVGSDGSYSFSVTPGNSFTIYLTTTPGSIGQTAVPTITMPTGWFNTGEYIGGVGSDGTPDGILYVGTVNAFTPYVKFGIDRSPTANDVTGTSIANTNSIANIIVPTLNGADLEQGTLSGTSLTDAVKIKTLPATGTLYYNGVAISAGTTISNYNPAKLTYTPAPGVYGNVTFTYNEVDDAGIPSIFAATVTMPFRSGNMFGCSYPVYQLTSDGTAFSTLYSYNLATGVRTTMGQLGVFGNAIGYNTIDGLLWGYATDVFKLISFGTSANETKFTVSSLPDANYNVGDIYNGYIYLYVGNDTKFYKVDINPKRSTYMQMVDQNTLSGAATQLNINDWAYNPNTNLLTTIINANDGTNPFKIATVNPSSGAVAISSTAVSGGGIQSETGQFGAVFIDNTGYLYVFNNVSGKLYKINLTTRVATYLSTAIAAGLNDGAACPTADLVYTMEGTVYDDQNGLTDNVINGTGTNAGNKLYAVLYNNSNGKVDNFVAVSSDGSYSLAATPGLAYTIYLTSTAPTLNQTAVPTKTLPSGWVNTGEKLGTTGSDGTVDGILILNTPAGSFANANFGVEQTPTANNVTGTTVANTNAIANVIVPTLNGSDPEQGTYNGTTTTDTVVIKTLPTAAMGVLYYNGVAVVAGDTIRSYVPANLTFTPKPGFNGNATFTYVEIDAAIKASNTATVTMPFKSVTPFACSNTAYQVSGGAVGTYTLTSYNVAVGSSTTVAPFTFAVNAIGYNTIDNLLYGWDNTDGQVFSVDAAGNTTLYTISGLPTSGYNVGDVNNGYLYLYVGSATTFYKVDINPARSTYMQLVATVTLSGGSTTLNINDWAYNTATGLLTGLVNPGASTNPLKIVTINPATGVVAYSSSAVTGTITSETGTMGAVFIDATNTLYAFNNTSGKIFNIDLSTYVALDVSTTTPVTNNDGASCPTAILAYSLQGTVYDDQNGLNDGIINGTATNAGGTLYAVLYDNTTGKVEDTALVGSNGIYYLAATPGNTFTVYLTTTIPTIGQTAVPTRTLPTGWVNTGEKLGTTGSDGTIDGILSIGAINADTKFIRFGIDQKPTANNVTGTSIPNIGTLTKLQVPTLNGSDPEQGTYDGLTTTDTVVIKTLPTAAMGTLYYNNIAVVAGDTIRSYDPTKLTFTPKPGFNGNATFTYVEVDAALVASNTATVTMPFRTVTQFNCNNLVYQVATNSTPSTLYSYNLAIGTRTTVATLGFLANGIGYNTNDNLLYGWDYDDNKVFAVDAAGNTFLYTVSGIPSGSYNVGDVGNGYLYLYTNGATTFYKIDINPASPTYLQSATTVTFSGGSTTLNVADWAYNPATSLITSLVNAGSSTNPLKIVTVNPTTGVVAYSAAAVTGSITSETGSFGAVYIDGNGLLYAFSNNTGKIYSINLTSRVATEISTAPTATNNDGASCPTAVLAYTIQGSVYDDQNGLTDGFIGSTGTNAGGTLYAVLYNKTTGKVDDTSSVASNGQYFLAATPGSDFDIYLTTTIPTIGQTAVPTKTLPTGWINTGEFVGGTGSDGTVNGILPIGVVNSNVSFAKFGIDQIPTANNVTGTSIPNTGTLTKLQVPTLNGSDPEQGTYDGLTTTDTVVIKTLPTAAMGTLYYNNIAVVAGDTIRSYNPAKLTFTPKPGFNGNATFTYVEVDAALAASNIATVTMPFKTITPVACNYFAYQVAGTGTNPSDVVAYNLATGVSTTLYNLGFKANAVGYNTLDGLMYGWDVTDSKLFSTDLVGTITTYNITLPGNPSPFVGDVANGKLYLLEPSTKTIHVVDVDPSSSTYLQLLTSVTMSSSINIHDWTYNPATSKLTAIIDPGGANAFYLATVDPATGVVTLGSTAVTGSTIATETSQFGAVFIDNTGRLYAFNNTTGNVYKINLTTNKASFVSAATAAGNNDGMACPTAVLAYSISGTVYNDANGLTDNTVNGTATNAGGTLYAALYNTSTNKVDQVAAVAADGTYSLSATPGLNYKVYVTSTAPSAGQTATPTVTLPTNWRRTGENLGCGTGSDGTVDGTLTIGTVSSDVTCGNFGIVQCPNGLTITANADKTLICSTAPSVVTLTSTPGGSQTPYTYVWTGSGLTANNTQNTTANPTASGVYTVTVTDALGCTASASTQNVTYDNNTASIVPVCAASGSSLQAVEVNGVSWFWTTTSAGRFYPDNTYSVNNDGPTSTLQAPYINVAGDYTVQITNANGCVSSKTLNISKAICNVLASDGIKLTAARKGDRVDVKWTGLNETGIKQYEVERSIDAVNFSKTGSLAAVNNGTHNYSFADDVSLVGCKPIYYRIKQVDINSAVSYSETVKVNCNSNDVTVYVLKAYPNPVNNGSILTINYTVPQGITKLQAVITDVLGHPVYASVVYPAPGLNTFSLPVNSSMAAGTYMLRLAGDKWISKTVKIVKQ